MEGLPVKAMVVGNGTFEKTLSQLKSVVCCGWLSGVALAEAYASSDILLFPSDVETFGNVTLEALASGCVSVVEDKCGGHLVQHGANGFTCTAGDEESYYTHTKRLVQDVVLRQQMSKMARESAWKFDRNKIMQQMTDNYREAIYNHRDPSFIKRYISSSPEAAGRNFLSFICCNYWFVKTFAEPFLNTSLGVQNIVHGTTECVHSSRSRLACGAVSEAEENSKSRYEDERKGRVPAFTSSTSAFIAKAIHYTTIVFSYLIIITFIIAASTL